jgi:hypothetical protein
MRFFLTVALAVAIGAGCDDSSITTTGPDSPEAASGRWVGSAADSITATLGEGAVMGQAGMGTMTWQIEQDGSRVTGTMSFGGMPGFEMPAGLAPGTLAGTIAGDQLTFTMTMPAGSLRSATCTAQATGTARISGSTMTGTYSGTNTCAGTFTNGQFTLTRQ